MKTITNQTIYQCEYCGKRLLSRNGAKIHENKYCWHPDSPHKKNIAAQQASCNHELTVTVYCPMPGEPGLQMPDYDICVKCNKKL
jgi:DNA-directed RNA polymerase subunit RPC12/RpoP